jgi:tetratricopeptide (TPR) repeat protein
MAIQSTIKEIGLFDLFQILHLHRKTGRLIIAGTPDGKEANVIFKEGAVCLASVFEGASKSVEEQLAEWGVLDSELKKKLSKKKKKYKTLIEAIEAEGITPRKQIENFIAERVRDTVFEIFKWEAGEYRFGEEKLDEKAEVLVPLNTENLILEGARRIDEWSNVRSKVPSKHSVFRFGTENQEDHQLNLKPREWEILSLIDGKRTVKEVNDAVGGDLFVTSKLIYSLIVMDVIELVDGEEDSEVQPGNEQKLGDLLKTGRNAYNKLNLEKAAFQFEKALKIDPDCFEALRMLGEIHYKLDNLGEALTCLSRARELDPGNEKAMFIKGYLHAHLGEISLAVHEWEELGEKTQSPQIAEVVRKRVEIAKEWERILQEY